MVPDLPGAMGSLDHFGVVQPQLGMTLVIINGSFPTFLNLNSCVATSPSVSEPKSCTSLSNLNSGLFASASFCAEAVKTVKNRTEASKTSFFISFQFILSQTLRDKNCTMILRFFCVPYACFSTLRYDKFKFF